MNKHIDKLQSTGLLAGLLALVCLPCVLAPLLVSIGLSSILVFLGAWLTPFLLVLVAVSLVGFVLSYRAHKNIVPILMALIAGGILYYSWYIVRDQNIAYIGALLLITAVAVDYLVRKHHTASCEDCAIKST